MTRIYWYAPFDNATEMDLASEIASRSGTELVVQSSGTRFGEPILDDPDQQATVVRNLPEPVWTGGWSRWIRQTLIVVERARLRSAALGAGAFEVAHIHTFNILTDWWSIPRMRAPRRLLVLSVHDVRPHRRRFPRRIEKALLGRGYRAADLLIVASDHLREQLVSEFGIEGDRIVVIPFAIADRDFLRESVGSRVGPLKVLFFGTFRGNKGLNVLLDALELIGDDPRVECRIVGRGEPELEALVADRVAVLRNVTAEIGYVPPATRREHLRWPDVIVLPYTSFNSQSAVLTKDAYAAGIPVIAARVGALGETVMGDGTGWLFPPGDSASLAQLLIEVAGDVTGWERRSENARRIARTRSVRSIANMLLGVYGTAGRREQPTEESSS